jgi:hypothetical protein
MSDSYQAIYDAVRSRISGGNIADAVADAARQAFDISYMVPVVAQEMTLAAEYVRRSGEEMQRPSVLMRPAISIDGDQWCALYGENLQDGVVGFGDTPDAAMRDFDKRWCAATPAREQHPAEGQSHE